MAGRAGIRFSQSTDQLCRLFNVLASPRSWCSSPVSDWVLLWKPIALITTITTTPAKTKKEGLQQGLQAWLQKGHRKQLPPPLPHALPQLFPAVRPHGFTEAPARHRHPNALDGSDSPASPRHPRPCWARVPSLDTASSTMSDRISKDASEAWRDHVLKQVVDCLLYTSPSPRDGLLSRMPSSA